MKENDEIKYYDEDFYRGKSERDKRIHELLEREAIIKREKNRLISEKPWYRKPQNLIAIFGVLFPIIVSFFVSFYQKENKELTVYKNEIEELISDSEHLKTNVYIKHDSSQVNNISKLSFTIKNTGSQEVSKKDFTDGPILLKMKRKDENKPIQILDVVIRKNANQQRAELNLFRENGTISYLPSLMNVEDKVCIDVYVLNTPKINLIVLGKISNGAISGPIDNKNAQITYGYKSFVLSIVSFFKYKWIAIAIMILLFIFTALSSLFQFVMLSEDELDPKVLGYFMALTTTSLSVLSIVIVISIFLY